MYLVLYVNVYIVHVYTILLCEIQCIDFPLNSCLVDGNDIIPNNLNKVQVLLGVVYRELIIMIVRYLFFLFSVISSCRGD